MIDSLNLEHIILLVGLGLALLLILILLLRGLYIYQTWVNRKMYELGEKVHNDIFSKKERKERENKYEK